MSSDHVDAAATSSDDLATPDEAYAAALAGLPGLGPASLAALLRHGRPRQVWADVRTGRIVPGPRGWMAVEQGPPDDASAEVDRAGAEPDGAGAGAHHRRGLAGQGNPGADQPSDRRDGRLALFSPNGSESAAGDRPGRPGPDPALWSNVARRIDPEKWWVGPASRGVRVAWPGTPAYPGAFDVDPQPPGVFFWRGSLQWLDHPCVAVVGTRRATPEGRALAFEIGRDLAASGVCVVSGLALGIDGAAHTGALSAHAEADFAGPVGLAASGVDVPYPRRHRDLWEGVATLGAVVSETLPGRPAEAWRFPLRNRLIAALAHLVVVVESDTAGGSLHTVDAALARGVDVRAVPGPVRSRASAGTNQLLYDGAGVVRNAQDVFDCLDLIRPAVGRGNGGLEEAATRAGGQQLPGSRAVTGRAATVLDAVGWTPTSLEQVVERSGRQVAATRGVLASLAAAGLVRQTSGWWVRTGREAK